MPTRNPVEMSIDDLTAAAWLVVNDVPFLRIEATAGRRAQFIFDDSEHRADEQLGAYFRDKRLGRLPVVRARFFFLVEALRDTGKAAITAEEFDAASRTKLQG